MRRIFIGMIINIILSVNAWAGGGLVTGSLTGGNSMTAPGVDVYHVKCTVPNMIRAALLTQHDSGSVQHVTIMCIEPLAQRGRGDKEIGVFTSYTIMHSEWAEAPKCKEAFIEVGCDVSLPCPPSYGLAIECVGGEAIGPWYQPKINR
jgi:hypothetical protein